MVRLIDSVGTMIKTDPQDHVSAEGSLHAGAILAWTGQGMVGRTRDIQKDLQFGTGLVMPCILNDQASTFINIFLNHNIRTEKFECLIFLHLICRIKTLHRLKQLNRLSFSQSSTLHA